MDILKREIARRVFAFELSRSNYATVESGERSPKYILTPTGIKCNRVFMIGVLLEKEEVSPDSNFWRLRISDPTGVVTGFVGRYQPEALESLLEIEPPAIVSIVAKLNLFQGETRTFLSLRPESINVSDRRNRDYWVIEAAKRTLERIRRVIENGEDEEVRLAREIYNPDLREYMEKVKRAVEVIREEAEIFSRKEEGERVIETEKIAKETDTVKIEKGEEEGLEEGGVEEPADESVGESKSEIEELKLDSFDLDEFEFEEEEWDLSDILDEEE